MTACQTKPVVTAGFSVFLAGLLWFVPASTVSAQDYIDVEAERNAARNAAGEVPVYSSTPGVVSGGASASSYPVQDRSEAVASPSESYSVPGIRPYSGQTVSVTPVESSISSGGVADVGSVVVQVQQLEEEVRRLNGVVEEQAAEIQRLKEQSLERYVDLDRRLAELSGGGAVVGNAAGVAAGNGSVTGGASGLTFGGAGSAGGEAQVPAQPGEEAAYQAAYDYVKSRNFTQAVEAFKGFLGDYPFGRFAPNAHYWLGELYLVIDPPDPELARQSFKLLLDQYPKNTKVPDALYKLGKVQYLKGNRDRSKEYLNSVIADYPGHPASQLAQDFLSENF